MVKLVLTFIMTPVLVHNLGNYDYGIWEIMTAVLGYMGLLDMGMKPAISRFAAKYHASDDSPKLQELYSTSFVFLTLVGLILAVFMVVWALFWPQLLSEGGDDLSKYTLLLFIIAAQLLIMFPGYVSESFLEGFQKYYLKNNITIFNSIMGASILYSTITPENALILLAGVNAIGLSVKYMIYMYILTRARHGGLKPIFSLATWKSFKETVGFGVKSLIQGIASRIEIGTDTIVIGAFLNPAMVPFYAIPANLIGYVRNIGWTLTHAFMPLFSEMHATNKSEEIRNLYLNASKYVVALLLPTCVGITLIGSDFIGVWVGEEYQKDADTIILLLVLYMALPFLNPFSTRYLTAIGQHGLLAKLHPISAVVNLTVSIILVQYWGIVGVAIGSVIPIFFLVPMVLKACCGFLGITISRYLMSSVAPSIIPTITMWCAVYYYRQHYLLNNYVTIIIAALAGAVVYCLFYYLISMKLNERQWLKAQLGKVLPGFGG
jgi:O-antigen/teichoic acid export membrane protein